MIGIGKNGDNELLCQYRDNELLREIGLGIVRGAGNIVTMSLAS